MSLIQPRPELLRPTLGGINCLVLGVAGKLDLDAFEQDFVVPA